MDLRPVFDWARTTLPAKVASRLGVTVAANLRALIRSFGARADRRADADTMLGELGALDDASLLRIVRAPETFHRVYESGRDPSADWLSLGRGWIDMERARGGERRRFADATWSALGDLHAPAGWDAALAPPAAGRPAGFRPDAPYFAPALDRIVIDFASPHAHRSLRSGAHRTVQLGEAGEHRPEERGLVLERLRGALDRLRVLCPNAHAFVLQMVRVIMPRLDVANPNFFTSASSRPFIGRVVLVNPHLPRVDAAELTSALVHEAVHAFLYARELDAPLFTDPGAVSGFLAPSPWTGAPLAAHSYLHACFVWYALLRLWHSPEAIGLYGEEAVESQRRGAAAGFGSDLLEPLSPIRAHVRDELLQNIAALRP